jgi:opacity protein-like surface antigen
METTMNVSTTTKIFLLGMTAIALYAQEDYRNDVTISALGSFQRSTADNGINQSATDSAGVLFTYRYFFTDHQGLELNYGYTRADEQFTPTTSTSLANATAISTNASEANLSYALRFGFRHRLRPFATAGLGAWVFSPINSFTVSGVAGARFATPDFVYSAGVDLALSRRVSFRLGYRGHVFQAPDFGVPSIATGAVSHMAEPFGGLSFHF